MKLMVEKGTRQLKFNSNSETQQAKARNGISEKMKVKCVLITQPKPENEKNPYFELARKHNITVDFLPFIYLEEISPREFRKQKINPADFNALIFTSRSAVDQFFKMCDDLRVKMSSDAKYYCMTE